MIGMGEGAAAADVGGDDDGDDRVTLPYGGGRADFALR